MSVSPRPTTWHEAPKGQAHEHVFKCVDFIRDNQQSTMRENWVTFLEAYAQGDITGLGREAAQSYYYAVQTPDGDVDVSFNLTAALIDTGASLISQAPVVPQYLTTDGDFKLMRQAEKASEILQGQFTAEVKEVMKRAWLDAAKIGTGFVFEKFDPITGMPGVERVSAFEVFVEYLDGLHMAPRSMHRSRFVAKETLKAQFPDFAEEIERAPHVTTSRVNELLLAGVPAGVAYLDFIEIVESWHLRPSKKHKGRHTICIGSVTLLDEEWKRDSFPCAVFRYRERDFGYYGAGLAESCAPAQNRINTLIRTVAKAQDLGSNLIIFNPNGADSIKPDKITNELGIIINYDPVTGPPTLAKWEGTLDDLQRQIDLEVQREMMVQGIAESQTNGQGAGRGLDSGAAVRAADDVQSRRLVPFVSRFQVSGSGVARLFEEMNDAFTGKKILAVGAGQRFLKSANWKAIRPPKGDARLQMAAMSALPTAPAAKWAAVQEWVQAGFTNRYGAMQLLQFPDLDAYASLELSHAELAKRQVEWILDGEYEKAIPDERQDIDMTLDIMVKSKMKALSLGADEDTIDAFERFIVECEYLQDQVIARQNEKAAAMGGGPSGGAQTGMPTQVVAPGLGAVPA